MLWHTTEKYWLCIVAPESYTADLMVICKFRQRGIILSAYVKVYPRDMEPGDSG